MDLTKLFKETKTTQDKSQQSSTSNEEATQALLIDEPESEHRYTQNYEVADFETVIVDSEKKLKQLVANLKQSKVFAFDTETDGLDPNAAQLVGISIAVSEAGGWYIPLSHKNGVQLQFQTVCSYLAPIFASYSINKIAHNANFDMTVLKSHGIEVNNLTYDTMIAAFLSGLKQIGLKSLSRILLGIEMTDIKELIGKGKNAITFDKVEIENAAAYATADAVVTYRLKPVLEKLVTKVNQEMILKEIELPLLPVIVEMQNRGILFDKESFNTFAIKLKQELAKSEEELKSEIGNEMININSNQQLAKLLIENLGAPQTRKTKTGWSMNAASLEKYIENPDVSEKVKAISRKVLNYRELAKLNSTYVEGLRETVNSKTNRVHTSYNQIGSSTGRLSSSNPNLQNIPVRTELGRTLRKSFIAKNNFKLVSFDYSQIELRVMVHFCKEPTMLKAFLNGEDVHEATAKQVYKTEVVTSEQRRMAKILNFGVLYGLGPAGITRQTDISLAEGKNFIKTYFSTYPGIKSFVEQCKSLARKRGYAETFLGRRLYLPGLNDANAGVVAANERVAVNMPIQGGAADIIKIAMVAINKAIKKKEIQADLLLQVHDELVFEIPESEIEIATKLIVNKMENACELEVPLAINVAIEDNWGQLKSA